MKNTIIILLLTLSLNVNSENIKTLKIITVGSGTTLETATKNALRSALEQSFGAFITSKSVVMDDLLKEDEITSITSGCIKKYNVISSFRVSDNVIEATVESEVTKSYVKQYIESKGYEVNFEGNLYAINLENIKINEESEKRVIENLNKISQKLLVNIFSFKIVGSTPKFIDNDFYGISVWTQTIPNDNFKQYTNFLLKTYSSISLDNKQIKELKFYNKPHFAYKIKDLDGKINTYYLRNENSKEFLKYIISNISTLAKKAIISDGLKEIEVNKLLAKSNLCAGCYKTQIDKSETYDQVISYQSSFECLNDKENQIDFDLSRIKINKSSLMDIRINLVYTIADLSKVKKFAIKNGIESNKKINNANEFCKSVKRKNYRKEVGNTFLATLFLVALGWALN